MSVLAIDGKSEHLETVKVLWRASSDTLGFLPDGAFMDYASQRRILVTLDAAGTCIGYLLYRVAKGRAMIAHLCIAETARGQGHSAVLIQHLVTITGDHRGIGLHCRRDFPAYNMWPKRGFAVAKETPGRAADGSELTLFWMDHNHPDLFTHEETAKLDAVIDSNVLVDLVESRSEQSQGLLADWLQDSVRLCVTPEHNNDFDHSTDGALRQKRRRQAANFHQLNSSPAEYQKAEALLAPLFPNQTGLQDESDFRHLARSLAGGAWAFVTRDGPLRNRADDVYAVCGLSIVQPVELIGRIDELLREHEYQRLQVAGTNRISRQRVSSADDALIDAIKAPNERKRHFRAIVEPFLADPKRYQCVAVRNRDEEVLALYVLEGQPEFACVPLFRVCSGRLAGTLSRSILTGLAHQAAQSGQVGVLVTEPRLTDDVQAACTDLGFLPVQSGRLKLVVSGVYPAESLADKLDQMGMEAAAVKQLAAVLRSPMDSNVASEMEHLLWPAKIADANLPGFIVAIRPEFAEHLFDVNLAKQGLFGADVDLALNPESVYYRSAYQRLPEFPGRILWYVKQSRKFEGTMMIRACSRIAEVCIDKPKALYKRFRRLGVYEWSHVLNTAKGDCEQDIMAVRFHDTELLQPVEWDRFQNILKKHGIGTSLNSPAKIPANVFNEIYSLALNSPEVR